MPPTKGALLEELVRAYFAKQGFFALRSVPLRFEREDVTDIDIWLYARQSAGVRTRAVVDVKNKKSPQALERVLWTKGLQAMVHADRAFVVTTDSNPHIAAFGNENKIVVLTKALLTRLQNSLPLDQRLSLEELNNEVRLYSDHKSDGDWIKRIEHTKSGLVSLDPFPAFNRSLEAFHFFADRIESRPHFAIQARRLALLCAAIGCVALDAALEKVVFEDLSSRQKAIADGITYGDSKARNSINNVLSLIEESMENGRAIARQANSHIAARFAEIRADIVAEYFSREQNSSHLVNIARELEAAAHLRSIPETTTLSAEARGALGNFADFCRIPRPLIIGLSTVRNLEQPAAQSDASQADQQSKLL